MATIVKRCFSICRHKFVHNTYTYHNQATEVQGEC